MAKRRVGGECIHERVDASMSSESKEEQTEVGEEKTEVEEVETEVKHDDSEHNATCLEAWKVAA